MYSSKALRLKRSETKMNHAFWPLLVLSSICSQSAAESITFAFAGTVQDVPLTLGSTVKSGDSVTGYYSFDSGAGDTLINDPMIGSYATSVFDWAADFGSYKLSPSQTFRPADITVDLDASRPIGNYSMAALATGDSLNGASPFLFALSLFDDEAASFTDDNLPLVPPDLKGFTLSQLTVDFDDGARIIASVDSLTLVPESLASSGFALLAFLPAIRLVMPSRPQV